MEQIQEPAPADLPPRKHAIKSFKTKADEKRTFAEKFADLLTAYFGSVTFLVINAIWFFAWILINTGKISGIEPFDPFPFGLLTMIVSLEAIFLAIIVLISQNRESRVNELREEVDLQINIVAEEELTKLIQMTMLLLKKQGIRVEEDPQLTRILGIGSAQIQRELEKQLAANSTGGFISTTVNTTEKVLSTTEKVLKNLTNNDKK